MAIIDVKLGAMNGLDVVRRLHTACAETRALFVTGYGDALDGQLDADLPVEGIIEKPFDVTAFLHRVKGVLARAGAAGTSA